VVDSGAKNMEIAIVRFGKPNEVRGSRLQALLSEHFVHFVCCCSRIGKNGNGNGNGKGKEYREKGEVEKRV